MKYAEFISPWCFQTQRIAFKAMFRYELVIMKSLSQSVCKLSWLFINPCQHSIAFHIEISHLVSVTNQMTGFYMKCNTGREWGNPPIHCRNIIKHLKFWFSLYYFEMSH